MRPKEIDIDVADANLTGFASNVTGATFTLTANVATDGLAHRVSILNDSANDHSGKTVTLVGTDVSDAILTEVVIGPAGSATVESSGYFKTLTNATPSATIGADTFDIGWVDEVSSQVVPINWRSQNAATINVDVTGTINFTVQETFDAIQTNGFQSVQWLNIAALTTKTADTTSTGTLAATALRIIVNSYSSGAELQMNVNQTD